MVKHWFLSGIETAPQKIIGIGDIIEVSHRKDRTELVIFGDVSNDKKFIFAYNISGYFLTLAHTLKKLGL